MNSALSTIRRWPDLSRLNDEMLPIRSCGWVLFFLNKYDIIVWKAFQEWF